MVPSRVHSVDDHVVGQCIAALVKRDVQRAVDHLAVAHTTAESDVGVREVAVFGGARGTDLAVVHATSGGDSPKATVADEGAGVQGDQSRFERLGHGFDNLLRRLRDRDQVIVIASDESDQRYQAQNCTHSGSVQFGSPSGGTALRWLLRTQVPNWGRASRRPGGKLGFMLTFGEKLKHERERRNQAIEDIASTTSIGPSYLEALERNEFDALPGGAFGKLYIRAYAEVLGFDPQPLIDEYERERLTRRRAARKLGEAAKKGPSEAERRKEAAEQAAAEEKAQAQARQEAARKAEGQKLRREEQKVARKAAEEEARRARQEKVRRAKEEKAQRARKEAARRIARRRAEREQLAKAQAPREQPTSEPVTPAAEVGPTRPESRTIAAIAGGAAILLLAVWGIVSMSGGGEAVDELGATQPPAARPESAVPITPAVEDRASEPEVEPELDPEPETPIVETPKPAETAPVAIIEEPEVALPPSDLTIAAFGLGVDVVNRRLVGSSDRFAEGSAAVFQTRVLGGRKGEKVQHVWHRQGRKIQAIELTLGGDHWRTHSRKTLWGTGRWTVEVRDGNGRVLATSEFEVTGK